MRKRTLPLIGVTGALAVAIGLIASTGSARPTGPAAKQSSASVTDYVKYVAGKPGAANPKLSPVKIGFVNNQGGSVVQAGSVPTDAAQVAAKWINKYAGGIGGHPLQLVTCFVKNVEGEGLKCGQQFVNDPAIKAIVFGAVVVGAKTIHATVAGKLPFIEPLALEPSDATQKGTYILFASAPFVVYGWGTFGQKFLHAKTAAVIYPQSPGITQVAGYVRDAAVASGIKTKLVGFDPKTNDLVGALTAAGAQTADMIAPIIGAPDQCLAAAKAMDQLGIDQGKAVGFFNCAIPSLKASYPGGDYPKWYYGIASSGDGYLGNAAGNAFRSALKKFGLGASRAVDPWSPTVFAGVLTAARFMNQVGADHLTTAAISAKASTFKGPVVLGPAVVQCGKYPKFPAFCADGDYFFKYHGNETFTRIPRWFETPVSLQKKNGAKIVTP